MGGVCTAYEDPSSVHYAVMGVVRFEISQLQARRNQEVCDSAFQRVDDCDLGARLLGPNLKRYGGWLSGGPCGGIEARARL